MASCVTNFTLFKREDLRKKLIEKNIIKYGTMEFIELYEDKVAIRTLKRWFALEDGLVLGFDMEEDGSMQRDPAVAFYITNTVITTTDSSSQNELLITFVRLIRSIQFKLVCCSFEERNHWIRVLQSLVVMNKYPTGFTEFTVELYDFDLLKVIGRGGFGSVSMCRDKLTQKVYAIKKIKKRFIELEQQQYPVEVENRVMKMVNHPFVMSLAYSFESDNHVCMILEYAIGGDLMFHVTREGCFSIAKTKFYAAEIVLGVQYLHDQNVIHSDLKLENVLITKFGHVKITDFSLSKENFSNEYVCTFGLGTAEYNAPEMLTGEYGFAVDWWALGVMMFKMICGEMPFRSSTLELLNSQIHYKQLEYCEGFDPITKSVLEGLLSKWHLSRLGGTEKDGVEIMHHPFFCDISWPDLLDQKVKPPFVPNVHSDTDTRYFWNESFYLSQISPLDTEYTSSSMDHFEFKNIRRLELSPVTADFLRFEQ